MCISMRERKVPPGSSMANDASAGCGEALELDPNYAMGFVWLAWTYSSDARFHWTSTPEDSLTHADKLARCASTIDDNLWEGHALLGAIYLMKKSYDEAVAHGMRSIEIEPNAADATATLAMTLNWCRPSEAAELVRHAMRLSPIHRHGPRRARLHLSPHRRSTSTSRPLRSRLTRSPRISVLTICYAQAGRLELACIQGSDDMGLYAQSLTYKDPEDSRRSLGALARRLRPRR
jgi:tetratricopeptide (TPR) repeat protein